MSPRRGQAEVIDRYVRAVTRRAPKLTPAELDALRRLVGPAPAATAERRAAA